MQLDIFSAAPAQVADLHKTTIPDLATAAARVGTPQQWLAYTLSQVLELWESLYAEFVGVLDAPIQHAHLYCKEHGPQAAEAGPLARSFYRREYERLVQGQGQLRATVENLFCDNLVVVIGLGQQHLRASGLSEEEASESHEFFNEVIQQPAPGDLGKVLPVLMQDLAAEYLRLQA